jgi:hypothetical protein
VCVCVWFETHFLCFPRSHTHMTCTCREQCGRLCVWVRVYMWLAVGVEACTMPKTRAHALKRGYACAAHTHTHRLEDFVVLEQLLAFREERLSLARFHGQILCFVHLLSYSTTRKCRRINHRRWWHKGRVVLNRKKTNSLPFFRAVVKLFTTAKDKIFWTRGKRLEQGSLW